MSEHQWTILIIGAATIIGFCIGRIAERVQMAKEKAAELAERRPGNLERRLILLRPDGTLPPAA